MHVDLWEEVQNICPLSSPPVFSDALGYLSSGDFIMFRDGITQGAERNGPSNEDGDAEFNDPINEDEDDEIIA